MFVNVNISHSFPIQHCLKQLDASSTLLFNFVLVYAIRNVHDNQAGLKLNGTHQLLAYADDWNILGDNTNPVALSSRANYTD
jgi:hypothetical protein